MLPAFAFGIALYGVGDRPSGALAMWRDLNAVRRVARLPELALEPRLCDIARDHALDMAARNYFSHESPEGKGLVDRLDRADWQYGYAAENIALDIDERSAQRRSTPPRTTASRCWEGITNASASPRSQRPKARSSSKTSATNRIEGQHAEVFCAVARLDQRIEALDDRG